jgi:hypothetical protein
VVAPSGLSEKDTDHPSQARDAQAFQISAGLSELHRELVNAGAGMTLHYSILWSLHS